MATKKPRTFEPGRKYRGSALLNEYGEFQFTPYNEKDATETGVTTVIKKTKDYTINLYKDVVGITIRANRKQGMGEIKNAMIDNLIKALGVLKNYEL